jgi:hypothetical protein
MQCADLVTDTLFPDISLIMNAMPIFFSDINDVTLIMHESHDPCYDTSNLHHFFEIIPSYVVFMFILIWNGVYSHQIAYNKWDSCIHIFCWKGSVSLVCHITSKTTRSFIPKSVMLGYCDRWSADHETMTWF